QDKYYGYKNSKYDVERVFEYIYQTYGIEELKFIIKNNDVSRVIKYAKEYSSKNISTVSLNIKSVVNYLTEDTDIVEEEENTQSNNANNLSKFSSSLKRKMRKGSVYKLNKINSDVEKASSNTQQQKQSVGESLNKYKIWSNGDYL